MAAELPPEKRMRISDDRYHRERLRMELALRFLRHEARTQTIRAWTGPQRRPHPQAVPLVPRRGAREMPRHRGKSPHQIAYFTRSCDCRRRPLALATPLWLLGVVAVRRRRRSRPARSPRWRAARCCAQAFEAYRMARPAALISFEHAVFLANALTRGEQLRSAGARLRRPHGDRAVRAARRGAATTVRGRPTAHC